MVNGNKLYKSLKREHKVLGANGGQQHHIHEDFLPQEKERTV